MRTMTKRMPLLAVVLAIATVLFTGPVALAQTYVLSNTTLNGAINASQTTLVLASASASSGSTFGAPAANQCLFVENELMRIVSMSSTTATVTRAVRGASPHATSAVIWTGACAAFFQADPPQLGGNQTCSSQPRPWINTNTANLWWCDAVLNKWMGTNYVPFSYNSVRTAQ